MEERPESLACCRSLAVVMHRECQECTACVFAVFLRDHTNIPDVAPFILSPPVGGITVTCLHPLIGSVIHSCFDWVLCILLIPTEVRKINDSSTRQMGADWHHYSMQIMVLLNMETMCQHSTFLAEDHLTKFLFVA